MDEYSRAHLTYMVIDLLCDSEYPFPEKGKKAFKKDVTVIICGNKPPEEIYT